MCQALPASWQHHPGQVSQAICASGVASPPRGSAGASFRGDIQPAVRWVRDETSARTTRSHPGLGHETGVSLTAPHLPARQGQ